MSTMSHLEYLAELNQRLMAHDDYQPGMEFVFAPPGATAEEATGYSWIPQEGVEPMRSIALEASRQINVISTATPEGPLDGNAPREPF